ncbi:MAG TPA: DinB family protein [Terriglobales bacterium]|nr:DinB family protein [Terriglobales bacterium]
MAVPQPSLTKDFALGLRDMMLNSISREMETTKKVIAAIPEARSRDYRPDPKARNAFELAWHIASVEVQMLDEIADGKFNMEPRFQEPKTVSEMLAWYETNLPRAVARVRALDGQHLTKPIDFYGAFNYPAVFYLGFVTSHGIHHRGQLSTYLRPMGSKVPSIYGGSADEDWKAA